GRHGGRERRPASSQVLSQPLPSQSRSAPPPAAFTDGAGFRPFSESLLSWIRFPSGTIPTSKRVPFGNATARLTTAIPNESLPFTSFSATSVRSAAITKIPVPGATWLTIDPGAPKLAWLFVTTRLRRTRVSVPTFEGLLGRRNTRIPPVLSWA